MWVNTVTPNLDAVDVAGYCLRMQQKVWSARAQYNTAWDSWTANQDKHEDKNLPDIPILIWFDHWGTYGGEYGQYGHVATHVPGRGILSNPGRGIGQKWYNTIEECERDCNAKYVGWTTSINGKTIAVEENKPKRKNDEMRVIKYKGADFLVGQQFISISPNPTVTALINGLYGDSLNVGDDWAQMTRITRIHGIPDETFDKLYNNNRSDLGYAWSAERKFFQPEVP